MKDSVRTWVKKVYGPYTRKDGRKHVVLYDGTKRQTVSYPKWLMEQHIGRELTPDETVDHKDRNFTNNSLDNLQILTRAEHTSLDVRRVKVVEVVCIGCSKKLVRRGGDVHGNAKAGKAGPFCRPCAGTYGANVRNKRIEKLPPQGEIPIEDREYYFKDK